MGVDLKTQEAALLGLLIASTTSAVGSTRNLL